MEIEMKDLAKFKENDSPETKELMQAYLDGHRNKKCPPSLFNIIIITIIILFILILLIIISNV